MDPNRPADPITDQQLADQLVEFGLINSWQASQLLLGLTKFSLGPYRIIDSLGQGGMGQVFKAEHTLLGQIRAIKVLPLEKTTDSSIEHFQREIRCQAQLDHDHLVRAYDAGMDGNVHYLVSEYVPGCDLRKLVRRDGPLDQYTAARIACQVADALQHAHDQGMVHRDVKPSNVLVTPDGIAKLSDLGLVGSLSGDPNDDPRFGQVCGTSDYVSPDQVMNPKEPTPLWDVYSLGCTLYFAVTGSVPFPNRGSSLRKVAAHLTSEPDDPRRLVPDLDEHFVRIIDDLMARDPENRIASPAEAIERIRDWLETSDTEITAPVPASSPALVRTDQQNAAGNDRANSNGVPTPAGYASDSVPQPPPCQLVPQAPNTFSDSVNASSRNSSALVAALVIFLLLPAALLVIIMLIAILLR